MYSTTPSCPLWRQRLGCYVSTRLGMDSKHFYVESFHFLQKHDASFWAEQLEEIAVSEFKDIMNGDQTPSWDALSTLPPATDVDRLGCYALQIRNPSDNERHLYPGSASGVDRWISYRIFEHVHQVHPSTSFLNRLLDDPLKPRTCTPRVTGIYPALKKGDQEELVVMRLALLLFEGFSMVMLKTFFSDKAGSTRQTLRELCPWYDVQLEWGPTNRSIPLAGNYRIPKALTEERAKYGTRMLLGRPLSAADHDHLSLAAWASAAFTVPALVAFPISSRWSSRHLCCFATPCYALQIKNPSDNERHLYPGSASGVDRWISYRILEHIHQGRPSTSSSSPPRRPSRAKDMHSPAHRVLGLTP
ncbi:hypothetical protein HDK64DRAFT_255671 [Phyllosticta capitalensis]